MSLYVLINRATAAFSTPNVIIPPPTDGPIPQTTIAPTQTFQLTITGNGSISATVQPLVSNDGISWSPYGDPVSLSGVTKASVGFGGSQNWKYYSALLPAISGISAQATLVMNG